MNSNYQCAYHIRGFAINNFLMAGTHGPERATAIYLCQVFLQTNLFQTGIFREFRLLKEPC